MTERTRGTKTSNFGVSKRENHDATAFYARFSPPEVSDDDTVAAPSFVDRIVVGAGHRGPITARIQQAFFDIVEGRVSDRFGWLTAVGTGASA